MRQAERDAAGCRAFDERAPRSPHALVLRSEKSRTDRYEFQRRAHGSRCSEQRRNLFLRKHKARSILQAPRHEFQIVGDSFRLQGLENNNGARSTATRPTLRHHTTRSRNDSAPREWRERIVKARRSKGKREAGKPAAPSCGKARPSCGQAAARCVEAGELACSLLLFPH